MKRSIAALTAAAVVGLTGATAFAFGAADVGKPAPAFAATDADGKRVDLARFRGKTVILEWTNNGCPYVRHVYASGVMQGLQKRAAAEGVVWLSVISSAPGKQGYLTPPEVKSWKAQTGAQPSDVILDPSGELGRLYGAKTTPTMVIIDPKGMVTYMGAIDDRPSADPNDALQAKNYVAAALEDMRLKRPISESETLSYGCSVKY